MSYTWLNKIKDQSGESLGEVLVALIVSSLALLMLAGVISASGKILTQSKNKMTDYYNANNVMVMQTTGNSNISSGTVSVKKDKNSSDVINLVPDSSSISVNY